MRRAGALVLALGLAACARGSPIAELGPDVYGLTVYAGTSAAAARDGVARARAHCTAQGRGFEAIRTSIGNGEYRIAFRCPRPTPGEAPPA